MTDRLRNGDAAESEWLLAAELLLRSDPVAAASLLEVALQHLPDTAQLHDLSGNALRMSGWPAEAEQALRKAIDLAPAHANASVSLAHLLREQGRMTALAEVMLALWRHEPRSLERDRRVLSFLFECARYEEADGLLPPLLADHPQDPLLLRRAGEIALILGRFDEARTHLRAALTVDPDHASTWLRLAHTHRFADAQDEDLHMLQNGAAREDLADDTQIAIRFALGKALDDLDQLAESVNVFKRANAEWRKGHRWNREGLAAVCRYTDTRAGIRALAGFNPTVPVFIVGLPRSVRPWSKACSLVMRRFEAAVSSTGLLHLRDNSVHDLHYQPDRSGKLLSRPVAPR